MHDYFCRDFDDGAKGRWFTTEQPYVEEQEELGNYKKIFYSDVKEEDEELFSTIVGFDIKQMREYENGYGSNRPPTCIAGFNIN